MTTAIRTFDLSKQYRRSLSLDDLNLEVPQGSIFGLVGPNGAGKTTTIKILMNLVQPTTGHAEVLGRDSRHLRPIGFTRIGYVSENQEMPDWMTVDQLLAYLQPFYPAWDRALAAQMKKDFELPGNRKLRHLSRGMWMKAALASSLAYRPELLILDEPFSGLDPVMREDFIQGILSRAGETTILISSHDLADIESFASHIAFLDSGRLRFAEEMDALSKRFRQVEVRVNEPPHLPQGPDWPPNWLQPEASQLLIRFVDTHFDPDQTPSEIHRRFGSVSNIAVHPMPLRIHLPGPGAKGKNGMRQAIHIFRKDVRYVRNELCLVLGLFAMYAWAGTHTGFPIWAEVLCHIAAAYLIARLIQAETLPGDKQFWLTRPYSRGGLISAKLLGILLLVNVPMFAARLYVLLYDKFPLQDVLIPLLWSQMLLFIGAMLPIAALAAVTSGIVPFTFTMIALVAVSIASAVSIRPPSVPYERFALTGSQWVWDSIALLTFAAFACAVLFIQYRARRTLLSRSAIVVTIMLGLACYLYVPWTTGAMIQTLASTKRFDPNAIQISLIPAAKHFYSRGMMGRHGYQVDVPLSIAGVPNNVELLPDGASITFQASDGTIWSSGHYTYAALGRNLPGPGPATLNANVDVPAEFFDRAKDQRVRLTADLYVSLFGNPVSKTIPIQSTAVAAVEGLQCRTGALRQLVCAAPFGWPSRLIHAKFPSGGTLVFTRFISYSPYPAAMAFDEVSSRAITFPKDEREVTIVSNQPLGSMHRTVTIDDFPLKELSVRIVGTTRKE